jgi:hypothetical protein
MEVTRVGTNLKGGDGFSGFNGLSEAFWPPIQPRDHKAEEEELRQYVTRLSTVRPPWALATKEGPREEKRKPKRTTDPELRRRPMIIVDGGPQGFHLEPLLPPLQLKQRKEDFRRRETMGRGKLDTVWKAREPEEKEKRSLKSAIDELKEEMKKKKEKETKGEKEKEDRKIDYWDTSDEPKTPLEDDADAKKDKYKHFQFDDGYTLVRRQRRAERGDRPRSPMKEEDCSTALSHDPLIVAEPTRACSPTTIRRQEELDVFDNLELYKALAISFK